ncbi:unnamed protein product [Diabrotica balteata]|uniref:Uncharacterized protein n=1 Tax=Diabrotica balteata TaxID=107213 RepID=A0A9N9XCB7_DIABA|nr:unnamed protein product [Diabrotica balteata]
MKTCSSSSVQGVFRVKYKTPLKVKTLKEYKTSLERRKKNTDTNHSELHAKPTSQHYDNLQQADNQKQPLKDTTNTPAKIKIEDNNNQEPESTQQDHNETPNTNNAQQQGSRSLQCLETLAQKAGIHDITPDDCKFDVANTLLNLDRGHEFIKQSVDGKFFR